LPKEIIAIASQVLKKHLHAINGVKTAEYTAWCNLKKRCLDSKHPQYKHYGGRGITVCDRWKNSFENFFEDMGKRPTKKHSIDRIDNNGNYEPNNCKWATTKEQSKNRRNNRNYSYNGETKNISEWALYFKVSHSSMSYRISKLKDFNLVYNFYASKK
jgi:hypothetical protein